MSPAPSTWDRMDPEERTAAVADLLAEGQAPSIISWKLKAPKPAIQRMAAVIRMKDQQKEVLDEPAAAVETARDYLREPAATVPGRIVREGDAPRETGRESGVASCPDTEYQGKPHGPEDGPEAQSLDRAGLPADSRAGDRQPHSASDGRPEGGKRLQVLRGPNHAAEPDENAIANGVTGGERAAAIPETPATSSQPVTAPERATSSPFGPAILPAAPDPSIPWAMLSARQKQAAVLPLRSEGLSANQIQARLQATSRCAVLGVVNRLRAAGHLPPAAGRSKAAKNSSRPPKPAHRKPSKALAILPGGAPKINQYDFKARAEQRAASQGLVISRAAAFDPIPGTTPLPYGSSGCKWPCDGVDGPGLFWCGQPREGDHSYCGAHRVLSISSRNERAA